MYELQELLVQCCMKGYKGSKPNFFRTGERLDEAEIDLLFVLVFFSLHPKFWIRSRQLFTMKRLH